MDLFSSIIINAAAGHNLACPVVIVCRRYRLPAAHRAISGRRSSLIPPPTEGRLQPVGLAILARSVSPPAEACPPLGFWWGELHNCAGDPGNADTRRDTPTKL